jgi:transposase InsO family protein
MSYSNNPLLPKARAAAVRLVIEQGLPLTIAARKSGIHRTTLWRWKGKWQEINQDVQLTNDNRPRRHPGKQFRFAACTWPIPTLSSRPHTSPRALPNWIVERIVYWRSQHERCAAIVHAHVRREGTIVSLSSVKRVLKRLHLLRPVSKWKRYRPNMHRPLAQAPGDLVQTDTVHLVDVVTKRRVYLYTLIDIYSRWSYVEYHETISQKISLAFLLRGQTKAGFRFSCIQSDNGPEFGRWLHHQLNARSIVLRHSRVRKPNDNAHIERFNRTVQEEGIHRLFPKPDAIRAQLENYLVYYNQERLHSSLQYRTPNQMLQRS